jgi:hypothetical protein
MYCIDYLFDFNDHYIVDQVRRILSLRIRFLSFFSRHRMDTDDDLLIVRNILHINMSICLLIAQFLFFFSINQIKSQVENKKLIFF